MGGGQKIFGKNGGEETDYRKNGGGVDRLPKKWGGRRRITEKMGGVGMRGRRPREPAHPPPQGVFGTLPNDFSLKAT